MSADFGGIACNFGGIARNFGGITRTQHWLQICGVLNLKQQTHTNTPVQLITCELVLICIFDLNYDSKTYT